MPREPHRILICDDDDDVRTHLEIVLENVGFRTRSVASGIEATRVLSQEGIDLVLLDIVMPGISGIETLRRIKLNPATARIPVVMLTAIDERETRTSCAELGCSAFLPKPVTEADLIRTILGALLDWQRPAAVKGS
jgi:CheY-like chemotaxis protein